MVDGWLEAMLKHRRSSMDYPLLYLNASCVKCDCVDKEMVRFGMLVFCKTCFSQEFKEGDKPGKSNPNYHKWMEVSYQKAMKEESGD